jgi:hypothetical protein
VAAVEEQFPVGPTKGDAAAQFSQVFPTRVIRSWRQIVFELGWCRFLFAHHPPKTPNLENFVSAVFAERIGDKSLVGRCQIRPLSHRITPSSSGSFG